MALGALATWAFQSGYHSPASQSHTSPNHNGSANGHLNQPLKDTVHALGTLEPQGGPVLVTSPLVGTRIKEVLVREGQLVTAGQRLIQLDATIVEQELRV